MHLPEGWFLNLGDAFPGAQRLIKHCVVGVRNRLEVVYTCIKSRYTRMRVRVYFEYKAQTTTRGLGAPARGMSWRVQTLRVWRQATLRSYIHPTSWYRRTCVWVYFECWRLENKHTRTMRHSSEAPLDQVVEPDKYVLVG